MGSGVPLPKQVPNDGRVVGIPVNGNPSLTTPTLQFNSVTNEFDWVAAGGAGLNDFVTGPVFLRAAIASSVGWRLGFDREKGDKLIVIGNVSIGGGGSLSAVDLRGTTAYQVPANRKFVGIAGILRASAPTAHQMNIRSSVTVDTNNGTIVYQQIDFLNSTLFTTSNIFTILANQFLTLEDVAGAAGDSQMQQIYGFETNA